MRVPEFFRTVRVNWNEGIELVIGVISLLQGLWLISPFFVVTNSSVATLGTIGAAFAIGGLQIVAASLLIYALFNLRWTHRKSIRAKCMMFFTFLFAFYGIAQMFVLGLSNVRWTSTIGISIISAILRVVNVRNG
jgi:hypothetical protein